MLMGLIGTLTCFIVLVFPFLLSFCTRNWTPDLKHSNYMFDGSATMHYFFSPAHLSLTRRKNWVPSFFFPLCLLNRQACTKWAITPAYPLVDMYIWLNRKIAKNIYPSSCLHSVLALIMIQAEAQYHSVCWPGLHNSLRSFLSP